MPTNRTNTLYSIKHGFRCIGLVLIVLLSFTAELKSQENAGDNKRQKPIKFSHQFHVKESGIACIDCHTNASKSVDASDNLLAKMESCKSCHEEQVKSNCTYCHISADSTTYSASPNPNREFRFSHQQHVEDQKIDCESCHTTLDKAGAAIGELVPAMAVCATCHNDVKATGACEKCHTNLAALRPAEHNRSDFAHEHKQLARMGDAKCGTCHTQESCLDCHNGSALVKVDVPGRDLMSQYSPRLTAIDRGQGMVLTKVHDLNFRFTHGIAAKSKTMECQTCHSQEQFCSTCHQAGGNVNQGAFKPSSHLVAGFKTLGVGSGGGEHARLAKRDIESCAACHGSEGADPVCITCHVDPDGIKGNDPKTHDVGFMSNTHGPWHSDPGANCYMCHTDINAHPGGVKGQKFCGYCHR
jgi:Cytochrome c7 and related cytochrome c